MLNSVVRRIRPITFGLMVLAMGSPALANYGSYSEAMTIPPTSTDFSQAVAFQSFNSSLGTLANIVISYTDKSTMTGFVQNTAPQPESFTVTENAQVNLTYGTTALLTNNLMASQSYTNVAANQSLPFGVSTPSGQASTSSISAGPIFNAFLVPSSNIMLDLGTSTSTSVVGGGGNNQTGIYTTVGATITVTFTYTPFTVVPEPASLALTSIGVLSLVGVQYRKRRAHA